MAPALFSILADSSDISTVIFRSIILIMLVIGGMYGVLRLRRWLKEDDAPAGGIGFTLSDLRALHRRGEITDAEFEKARAQMLAGAKEMSSKLPDPLARPDSSAPQRPR